MDEDLSTKIESDWKRLNMLAHYQVHASLSRTHISILQGTCISTGGVIPMFTQDGEGRSIIHCISIGYTDP